MKHKVGTKVMVNAVRFRIGMLTAFGLIWTSAVLGEQTRFFGVVPYEIPHPLRAVAIGDFNGDQVADLAVANTPTSNLEPAIVSVWLGVRDGTPAAPVHYYSGGGG